MKSKYFLIFYFFLGLFVSAQDKWEVIGNMPNPVAEGELVFYQTSMYLLGGYSETTQHSINRIQSFDPTTQLWVTAPNTMIEPRVSFVSLAYGGAIYSVGGASAGATNSGSMESYNFNNASKIEFNSNDFYRNHASGVLYGRRFFLIGGNPEIWDTEKNDPFIVYYDLNNDYVVSVENEMFKNRKLPEQQMAGINQDEIYIFGGVINGVSRDIYKYDISDSVLVKLNIQLMEPRAAGEIVKMGDEGIFFIIGGYNENNDALKSVEIFSCSGDDYRIWSGPELNFARKNFMSSFNLGKLYVMGGYDAYGNVLSSIEVLEPITSSIDDPKELPTNVTLKQNYPNPFNPTTNIDFTLEEAAKVDLDVYSINGEHVTQLVSDDLTRGSYSYSWDGKNIAGRMVSTGVYLYVLKGKYFTITKKMILLK